METTICHNCGTESSAGTRFCPSCGLNLEQVPEVRAPAVSVHVDEEEQDVPAAPAQTVLDDIFTLDIPVTPWHLHANAIFCEGRYVVDRPLDHQSPAELNKVFLGHDVGGADNLIVCEDIGTAPTTEQLVTSLSSGAHEAHLSDRALEEDSLLGSGLGERRKQLLALSHPRFSSILDVLVVGERLIMVRSYVEGRDLQTLLTEGANTPLTEADVLNWAEAVLDILIYLHSQPQPVVHGDIKPSHLILDGEGHLHLVGLACLGLASGIRTSHAYNMGEPPVGTAGYAPPEQYRGEESPSWDLYALGATLHYVATQRDPRDFRRPGEQGIYPPPRWINLDLSERTEALIMRAVDTDPHKRYFDAVTMRDDVLAARPEQRTGRRWPWSRK